MKQLNCIFGVFILFVVSGVCHAQDRFLFTAGLLSSPFQAYATSFTPEYIYIPEVGTVYTKNTRNISMNLNTGVYADFERKGWHLRASTILSEENVKFATEEISSSGGDVNFHHRAYHLLTGVQLGIPLLGHTRTKIILWSGINIKAANFSRNYNGIDRLMELLTESKSEGDLDDSWSAKLDLTNNFTLPRTVYTLHLQFGNPSYSYGIGVTYQSAKLDLLSAKNPYLFQHSFQGNLLFTKTIFYGYR